MSNIPNEAKKIEVEGATVDSLNSKGNEEITVTFNSNEIHVCMIIERFDSDGNSCEEQYCSDITSVWKVFLGELSIYPNPTTDILNIQIPEYFIKRTINVKITDITGKKIFNQSYEAGSKTIQLDVNALEEGLYLISIKDNMGLGYFGKFIRN